MNTGYKVGDLLTVTKSFVITHMGIYAGYGMVIDNSSTRGRVTKRTLKEFEGTGKAYRVLHNSKFPPNEIVKRAESHIGKPYGVLSQNCEHFVNDVLHGIPRSPQVRNAVFAFATIWAIKRMAT